MSKAPLIVALLVAASGTAFAQQCQCIDIGDIKARKKEASTAIEAYGAEMNKIAEQMQRTQDPVSYNPARRAGARPQGAPTRRRGMAIR